VSIAARVVRMEDDARTPDRGPAHRLGIAPALVADRHAEPDPARLEEAPAVTGYVEAVFARVELVLRLVALDLAPGVDLEIEFFGLTASAAAFASAAATKLDDLFGAPAADGVKIFQPETDRVH